MKKLLGFLMALVIIPCCLLFTSCDKITSLFNQDIVNKDGLFKSQTVYNINQKIEDLSKSIVFTFEKDGTGTMEDLGENKTTNIASYKVINNLIEITDDDDKTSYLDYFKDFIGLPMVISYKDEFGLLGTFIGVREGQVISERSSTKIVGYHAMIYVMQGAIPAVFTGKSDSKGQYITYYADGSIKSKTGYLAADQISGFDSSEVGQKLVDVTISGTKIKAVLNVAAND